jgi:hypothetical protein
MSGKKMRHVNQIINHVKIKILTTLKTQLEKKLNKYELRIEISKKERNILDRNKYLYNRHINKPAFVIANGPSLAKLNLRKLENYLKFAMSGFWKHEILNEWQPDYYCLTDKTFFRDSESIIEFYKNLEERIKSTYLLPLMNGRSFIEKNNLLTNGDKYYFLTYGDDGSGDFSKKIRGFQSVATFALANAVNMGCSPIYLIGYDHDFLANRGIAQHFYQGAIIKDHWSNTLRLDQFSSYYAEMKSVMRLWDDYYFIKKLADSRGIKIYNATENSYLDIFDRVNFDDIF